MTALTRRLRTRSTVSPVMRPVAGSTSAKRGVDPGESDGLGGGDERVCGDDHLVVATKAERAQTEHERIGSRGDTDDVLDSAIAGECLLEGSDLRAERERRLVGDVTYRTEQLPHELGIAVVEPGEWNELVELGRGGVGRTDAGGGTCAHAARARSEERLRAASARASAYRGHGGAGSGSNLRYVRAATRSHRARGPPCSAARRPRAERGEARPTPRTGNDLARRRVRRRSSTPRPLDLRSSVAARAGGRWPGCGLHGATTPSKEHLSAPHSARAG